MTHTDRLAQSFDDLYDGHPWLEITLMDTLGSVTAAEAAAHPIPGCHSVWELVNHLAAWRANVLRRVQGEVITTPAHNYFEPIDDASEPAWQAALAALGKTQRDWKRALATLPEQQLQSIYPNNGLDHYQQVIGIIEHDAYHLGQIVLLLKLIRGIS